MKRLREFLALETRATDAHDARRWAEARDHSLIAADLAEEQGASDLALQNRNFARRMHVADWAERIYGDHFIWTETIKGRGGALRGERRTFIIVLQNRGPGGPRRKIRVRVGNDGRVVPERSR